MAKLLLLVAYYLVFGAIYLGFIFHESHEPAIFQYSTNYFLFLLVLTSGLLVPPVLLIAIGKYGYKNILLVIVPPILLFSLAYGILAIRYYYTQIHLFDPYLQVPPPALATDRLEKPESVYRIIALGGSTTRNPLLPVDKRYPTVLQDILRAQYGQADIEVFNAGMDWYTTKHSLINYVTNLSDAEPDLIVVMHAVNDLYRSFSPPGFTIGPYHRLWSHFYGPAIYGARPPAFAQHLSSKIFWPSLTSVMYSQIRLKERDLALERYLSLEDFQRNLLHLIHYLKADGIPIIVMTQPFLFKENMSAKERASLWFGKMFCLTPSGFFYHEYPSPESLRRAMLAYNDITREMVRSEGGVLLLDLEPKIEKSLANFTDDVHYTAAGARQVAMAVAKKIDREMLVAGID